MSASARLPRLVAANPDTASHPADRSCEAIRTDLATLSQAMIDTGGRINRLTAVCRKALVAGDDETVETHDTLIARAKRRLERAEHREPDLADALVEAAKREAELARQRAVEAARAFVESVVADLGPKYKEPAERIAPTQERCGPWR